MDIRGLFRENILKFSSKGPFGVGGEVLRLDYNVNCIYFSRVIKIHCIIHPIMAELYGL